MNINLRFVRVVSGEVERRAQIQSSHIGLISYPVSKTIYNEFIMPMTISHM